MAELNTKTPGKPLSESAAYIVRRNATWHELHSTGRVIKDGNGGFDADPNFPPKVRIAVYDVATGTQYPFFGEGPSKDEAMADAAEKLRTTAAPKSPSEQAAAENMPIDEQIAIKKRELDQLVAKAGGQTGQIAQPQQQQTKRITTGIPTSARVPN